MLERTVWLSSPGEEVVSHARRPSHHLVGQVEQRGYECVRQGTANLFVLIEPLAGGDMWR